MSTTTAPSPAAAATAAEPEFLPPHVYPNWLLLAARVVSTPPEPDTPDDTAEWRIWAREHLIPAMPARQHTDTRRPPARGTRKSSRIGCMNTADAGPLGDPGPKRAVDRYR